jgi:hypothetical protein
MGMWGYAPWEDDDAADWFGEFMDATGVAQKVEEALQLEVAEENAAIIRSAATMLLFLGRTYIWPIDDIDRHLDMAITKLKELHAADFFEYADYSKALRHEIEILEARRAQVKAKVSKETEEYWLSLMEPSR